MAVLHPMHRQILADTAECNEVFVLIEFAQLVHVRVGALNRIALWTLFLNKV